MSQTTSTSKVVSKSMEQKEQEWTAWWAPRAMRMVDDGSQSVWEKEKAVLREKKNWWFYTFGEQYLTEEDKEREALISFRGPAAALAAALEKQKLKLVKKD